MGGLSAPSPSVFLPGQGGASGLGTQRAGLAYREHSDHFYPLAQSAYFPGLQFILCPTLEMRPVIVAAALGCLNAR